MRDKRKTDEMMISAHAQSEMVRLYRYLRLSRTHDIEVNATSEECLAYLENLCQPAHDTQVLPLCQRRPITIETPIVEPSGELQISVATSRHRCTRIGIIINSAQPIEHQSVIRLRAYLGFHNLMAILGLSLFTGLWSYFILATVTPYDVSHIESFNVFCAVLFVPVCWYEIISERNDALKIASDYFKPLNPEKNKVPQRG